MIPWLALDSPFPDIAAALTEKDGAPGLLAAGADLSPDRLLDAYRQGIFPWFSENQPILWWSTDPRMVLLTSEFLVSRSLLKTLKKIDKSMANGGRWQVRFDSAFDKVIRACAAPRSYTNGTWISQQIIDGYSSLHERGFAHCAEVWLDDELVGGAYGVCIGRMFYGESMFAQVTDASKIALAYLVRFLKMHGVDMIDCQQETAHLASLGAAPITRAAFIQHMKKAIVQEAVTHWQPVPLFDDLR